MKKIVKCILPIVSSAALAAPVLISCGQTYKALPDEAFEIHADVDICGLSQEFTNWDKYNTLLIRPYIRKVMQSSFVGEEAKAKLNSIKYIKLETTTSSGLGFDHYSVGDMGNLQKIIFSNNCIDCQPNTFIGKYPNLKVLDYSSILNFKPTLMSFSIFSDDNDIPETGTIYVNNKDLVELVKQGFGIDTGYGQFKDWKVKVK